MIHKLLVLFRDRSVSNGPTFLGLLVNSAFSKKTEYGIGECWDWEDGIYLRSQGCRCFQKQYFVNVFVLFYFGGPTLRLPLWLLTTGLKGTGTNEQGEVVTCRCLWCKPWVIGPLACILLAVLLSGLSLLGFSEKKSKSALCLLVEVFVVCFSF